MSYRYPTINKSNARELADQLVGGHVPALDPMVEWVGAGEDLELYVLESRLEPFILELQQAPPSLDQIEVFEGRLAAVVHASLREVPVQILDDRGFWRYLSFRYFWWYTSWREASPISNGHVLTYVDGAQPVMAIPSRLYLRAQSILDGDDYSPASALPRSTDFWRSHVLRVRVGTAPKLSRAFVRLQSEKKMKTEPVLRPYAKRLNRTWSNVVLSMYEEAEAYELLTELYDATMLPPPSGAARAPEVPQP